MITKAALRKLKSKLPRNYRKELAKRTGLSESAVYRTLKGDLNNTSIIEAAIQLAKENKDRNNTQIDQINSL